MLDLSSAVYGWPADIGRVLLAEVYHLIEDYPTSLADMKLGPSICFASEPRYAIGRHGVRIGGTVIVGEDERMELNSYTAETLRRQSQRWSIEGMCSHVLSKGDMGEKHSLSFYRGNLAHIKATHA